MTEETSPPSTDAIAADALGSWWHNPNWWPLFTLVPVLLLAALCGHSAAGMDEAAERLAFVKQGAVTFSVGTLLYVGLIAAVSRRWNGGAKVLLSLTTSAILAIGGAIWFAATFKTITARPTLAWFWTPEPWASGTKGTQLCIGWGVILFCAVVYLAFDSKRKSAAADRAAQNDAAAAGTSLARTGTGDSGG